MRFPDSGVMADQKGLALPSVLIFALVFVILLAAVFTLVSSNYAAATANRNRVTALLAAEAGINEAIARFDEYMDDASGGVPRASFDGVISDGNRPIASYSVSIVRTSQNVGVIRSTGQKGQSRRTVQVGINIVPTAWRHVVYADVDGHGFKGRTLDRCNPSDVNHPYGPRLGQIPEPNFEAYRDMVEEIDPDNILQPDGEKGSVIFTDKDSPVTGIYYIEGDLTLEKGLVARDVCFIVEGNIVIKTGSYDVKGYDEPFEWDVDGDDQPDQVTLPVFIAGGEIKMTGGGAGSGSGSSHAVIEGLWYSAKGIEIGGATQVYGSLVAPDIDISGNADKGKGNGNGGEGDGKVSIFWDHDGDGKDDNFCERLTRYPPPFFSRGQVEAFFRTGTWEQL